MLARERNEELVAHRATNPALRMAQAGESRKTEFVIPSEVFRTLDIFWQAKADGVARQFGFMACQMPKFLERNTVRCQQESVEEVISIVRAAILGKIENSAWIEALA